uniref:Transketolase, N-terminal section n=1 Tax=uncultured bacterium esnapd17 TaxID=1366598 RepID=S5UD34_9BACT|nr:transketolase, N-terminal section [uncultured bacterium esnapd17]
MTAPELAYTIRRDVLRMAAGPNGAHVGGSLSCADILAVLFTDVLRRDRDAFVLSKGHAAPALYAVLAEQGLLEHDELAGYASPGSRLFGHPHNHVPGIEFNTGSLGHGLGLGTGLALSAQLTGCDSRTYVLLGDGELQEGSVWEAFMFAAHRRLTGLTAVIDRNGLQITGPTDGCVSLEPLTDRLAAFGWQVRPVDGHDHAALRAALAPPDGDRPVAVVAATTKGKGVGFLEGKTASHYATFDNRLLSRALAQLDAGRGAT